MIYMSANLYAGMKTVKLERPATEINFTLVE